ncbi:MAG: short-chain fatty acid transporter [Candidatus Eremiobacteraeota bacterium]|nr:short-chain fatty acid transporter [Candidatus Eremiobacteraeota bacterium]
MTSNVDEAERPSPLSAIVGAFVALFERILPDPYLLAVLLTLLTAVLALIFAPHHAPMELLGAWYSGIFQILEFAFQMILILVTGYALANAKPVRRVLESIASLAGTPRQAIVVTFLVSAVACWLNWGFGLIVAALMAREIAKRIRVDFGWLVAAAYSGFLIWASGLSSSIALAQATPGSNLNIVHKLTGSVVPLSQSIFTAFNLVPVVVLLIAIPIIYTLMQPPQSASVYADPERLRREDQPLAIAPSSRTLASALENAWILNLILALAGIAYIVATWTKTGFSLDIKSVIFIFLILGLLLHWRPIAYVGAVNNAARITGPLMLQYPLYGGTMGMMTGTGLAGVIAQGFVAFSTAATLPFWSYLASVIISLFVPSGGGHWAVQGPFVVPAAVHLHASQAASSMGVAMGEEVANMIQPFWALPIIAIAGIGIRRVMGFTVVSFVLSLIVYALALLFLAH